MFYQNDPQNMYSKFAEDFNLEKFERSAGILKLIKKIIFYLIFGKKVPETPPKWGERGLTYFTEMFLGMSVENLLKANFI